MTSVFEELDGVGTSNVARPCLTAIAAGLPTGQAGAEFARPVESDETHRALASRRTKASVAQAFGLERSGGRIIPKPLEPVPRRPHPHVRGRSKRLR